MGSPFVRAVHRRPVKSVTMCGVGLYLLGGAHVISAAACATQFRRGPELGRAGTPIRPPTTGRVGRARARWTTPRSPSASWSRTQWSIPVPPPRSTSGSTRHGLRVEVEDQHPGRALPTGPASPDDDAESGRGLAHHLVASPRRGASSTPRRPSGSGWSATGHRPRDVRPRARGPDAAPVTVEGTAVAVVAARRRRHGHGLERRRHPAVRLAAGAGRRAALPPDRRPRRRPPTTRPGGSGRGPVAGRLHAAGRGRVAGLASSRRTRAVATDGSAALLLVPEAQRALLEHPAARRHGHAPYAGSPIRSACATTRCSGCAVDDYLPLATERVRDALDADATYLLHRPRGRRRVRGRGGQRTARRRTRDPDRARRSRRPRHAEPAPARRDPRRREGAVRTAARDARLAPWSWSRCRRRAG